MVGVAKNIRSAVRRVTELVSTEALYSLLEVALKCKEVVKGIVNTLACRSKYYEIVCCKMDKAETHERIGLLYGKEDG